MCSECRYTYSLDSPGFYLYSVQYLHMVTDTFHKNAYICICILYIIYKVAILYTTGCLIIIDAFQHNGNLQQFIRDCQ